MDYKKIYEEIDNMVRKEYPKVFLVKVFSYQEQIFNKFAELTIELKGEDYNKVVYHEPLEEINLEIKEHGFNDYINKLKSFLGKIVSC